MQIVIQYLCCQIKLLSVLMFVQYKGNIQIRIVSVSVEYLKQHPLLTEIQRSI